MVAPEPETRLDCIAAPLELGATLLVPREVPCISLEGRPGGYAVGFFDSHFLEASRDAPEAALAPAHESFAVTLRLSQTGTQQGGQGVAGSAVPDFRPESPGKASIPASAATRRGPAGGAGGHPDGGLDGDLVRFSTSGAGASPCYNGPGYDIFCRERPWEVGDTLTIPAVFGRFIEEKPRSATILLVHGPFAFAVPRSLKEPARQRLEPLLETLAKVGLLRIVPLLRRSILDEPAFTSPGSRQILVDVQFDEIAICVCGVTVGEVSSGEGVAGVSIRLPDGAEFEADRVGLFAHELTHVWQHLYQVRRTNGSTRELPTVWALEGGADLIRQEILRELARRPLAGNHDATERATNIYLDRFFRSLRVAEGDIRAGYGESAGLLRHFFLEASRVGVPYEDALGAVLLGSLEGWFPSTRPQAPGDGLAGRLGLLLPGFEPAEEVLSYALANAADDRTSIPGLQNRSILETWRESHASSFTPEATLDGSGTIRIDREAGAVGYVYVRNTGTPSRLEVHGENGAVRWMVVRFE